MSRTLRILVAPGIGDIYWVLVKLEALLQYEEADVAEITIASCEDPLGGHLRSLPFLELFAPHVTIGNPPTVPNDFNLQHIWNEAYIGPGRAIFPGIMGFDYLMAYNGRVNSGGWIEDDRLTCNWQPFNCPILAPLQPDERTPHMLLYFPFHGTYARHEADFPVSHIASVIKEFIAGKNLAPIFIGSALDKQLSPKLDELVSRVDGAMDCIGQTSLVETLQLIRNCRVVFGYHAGITNLAAAVHQKTLLLWDDRFPASTSYAVAPPAVRGTTYRWLPTKDLPINRVVTEMETLYATP